MLRFEIHHCTLQPPVLGPIQLHLTPGETLVIVGRSGCGKTTLLNRLARLCAVAGEGWQGEPPTVGYLFQEPRLLPWRNLQQNLQLVCDNPVRVAQMLVEVGMDAHAHKRSNQISLGMARRVALARCLLLTPQLILMDEPLASLDPDTAQQMRELIQRLVIDNPLRSLIYVTHDLEEACQLADRILLLGGNPARVQAEFCGVSPEVLREQIRQEGIEAGLNRSREPACSPVIGSSAS